MIYLKKSKEDFLEQFKITEFDTFIEIYSDELCTYCEKCKKEIILNEKDFKMLANKEIDFNSTFICEECSKKINNK